MSRFHCVACVVYIACSEAPILKISPYREIAAHTVNTSSKDFNGIYKLVRCTRYIYINDREHSSASQIMNVLYIINIITCDSKTVASYLNKRVIYNNIIYIYILFVFDYICDDARRVIDQSKPFMFNL